METGINLKNIQNGMTTGYMGDTGLTIVYKRISNLDNMRIHSFFN